MMGNQDYMNTIEDLPTKEQILRLFDMIDTEMVSRRVAVEVLYQMFLTTEDPDRIIEEQGEAWGFSYAVGNEVLKRLTE